MAFTAFHDQRMIASGALSDVAQAVEVAAGPSPSGVLIFDDATGMPVDIDLRSGADAAVAAHETKTLGPAPEPARSGPGRPRLGVVAREVTLLPRHWKWLSTQRGGASAALRRLVEEAQRAGAPADRARMAQQALHGVLTVLAGDLPGYEEALRALYARDDDRFDALAGAWPADIAAYVSRLAEAERSARAS
ncbi:DUF2239 family protein [Phenylobacterium sp.]|uniref:DUF2239 family protein n=1 Tax=Phenylobacterium sp. TaxID=1871053 RepID=UPI00391B9A23